MARSRGQRSALIRVYWAFFWRYFLFGTLPSLPIGYLIGFAMGRFGLAQYTVLGTGMGGLILGLVVGYLALGSALDAHASDVRTVISTS